ncbi:MAG: zinc-ribbon domain containing protein [Patescibacteria group bacterium]
MSEELHDRILVCSQCHEEFVFTTDAQRYWQERGYTHDPQRCKHCHTKHKKQQRRDSPQPESSSFPGSCT